MGIKSDKTFEEIVERLVALFAPQPENSDARAPSPPPSKGAHGGTPSATISVVPEDKHS